MYLDQRKGEVSEQTLSSHGYRLEQFVEWCEEVEGIHNLNDLTGRKLHTYRVYRRQEDDIKPVTLQGQLSTLRMFLRFCASVDAVHEGLAEKILLPSVPESEQASRTTLDEDRAADILEHLRKYQYASRDHVVLRLLWCTGIRMGSARAIDLEDFDRDAPGVELVHRPGQETPLKNKEHGERWVALRPETAEILEDYIDGPRADTRDEYDREPLLTTAQGRVSTSCVRNAVYGVTRPCEYGPCPHDRKPEDCDATEHSLASKCPSSRSPHDVRSGAITSHLLDEVPVEIVSDRMDVSQKVLDKHYDRRTEREKMEQRREYLRN
ncbi:site-specific integrase [Halosimplex rubrum]|uniref:Site-specific integrase n=1 Tax=Halosimplex rubrum TaxID=869889 RepID=A0A7D5T711_9EURY|nr:site-specific integrase [Halosimplex rubrum]